VDIVVSVLLILLFDTFISRLHRYAKHKMWPVATDVAWSLCLYVSLLVLATTVSPTKETYVRAQRKGQFSETYFRHVVKYMENSVRATVIQ